MRMQAFGAVVAVAAAVATTAPARAQAPMMLGLGAAMSVTPEIKTVPVANGFNLRLSVGSTPRANPLLSDEGDMPVHRRLLSAMVDFFPGGGNSGFHVSGGTLREFRTKLGAEAAFLNPTKLVTMGVPAASTFRGNMQRATPAMTVGYSLSPARNMNLSLDAGSAFGRMNTMASTLGGRRYAGLVGSQANMAGGFNPVVHLAFGMKF